MERKIKSLFKKDINKFSYRECNKENCNKSGIYKAPKSPDNLRTYIWFCEDHIREYTNHGTIAKI